MNWLSLAGSAIASFFKGIAGYIAAFIAGVRFAKSRDREKLIKLKDRYLEIEHNKPADRDAVIERLRDPNS